MLGKLFNKIHILQNIYLKNKYFIKKKSYAMDGEDLAIQEHIKITEKGFYVDIGAHHPIQRNNTNLLFINGWEGINIDANQFSIDLFNYLRPQDLNILTAISDKEGEVTFYYQKEFSQLNTTDKKVADQHFHGVFKERQVKSQSIQNILDNSKYKNKKIDFLNIDIEGMDLKIIKQILPHKFKPKLISIETHNPDNVKSRDCDQINNFLINNDYKVFKRVGPTTLFNIN